MGVYIDIALSLVFIYLVLSLVVSAVNELIAMWLRKRPAMLAKSILSLIDDGDLRAAFYRAGALVNPGLAARGADQAGWTGPTGTGPDWRWKWYLFPTRSATSGHPSFIDGATFARALTIGALKRTAAGELPSDYALKDVRDAVAALDPESQIREVLVAALANARDSLEGFEKQLETWYDRAQDRLTGEYTRWAKVVTLIIGAGLVCLTNADTVRIARELQFNKDARQGLVASAIAAADPASDSVVNANCEAVAVPEGSTPTDQQVIDHERCVFKRTQGLVRELGPNMIGWAEDDLRRGLRDGPWDGVILGHLVNKLLGLLITVAAISLGAPFWFDMLSKVVNIRAAGPKPPSISDARP